MNPEGRSKARDTLRDFLLTFILGKVIQTNSFPVVSCEKTPLVLWGL